MTQPKLGVGLCKEEREYVEAIFSYDELWDYLRDQGISETRIERLEKRLNKAIREAVAQEAI